MAERRMFAKTIIDSDAFLDMPLSSQALYFHLSMRADDEGFINNPKKIQRMIGASDDDMKVLIAKSFIIKFDTGIIVIKHWKIHNYIRGDRLQETKYQEERQLLDVKENGAYTFHDTLREIPATEKRRLAYEESELPYSFTYKIRRAFNGKTCPVCGCSMSSGCKSTMPTIQHNKPISKGGKHTLGNISVICESCNVSIKDNETGSLNNADVVETWQRIQVAEKENIDWFYHTELLDGIDVRQVTDICQTSDSIGKDRLGKDRLGEDSLDKDSLEKGKGAKAPKRFQKPSLEEIQAYIWEKGYSVNADTFFNYYESNGWKVGRNPMKDWKACIRTWQSKEKSQPKQKSELDEWKELYEQAGSDTAFSDNTSSFS